MADGIDRSINSYRDACAKVDRMLEKARDVLKQAKTDLIRELLEEAGNKRFSEFRTFVKNRAGDDVANHLDFMTLWDLFPRGSAARDTAAE